MIDFQRPRLMQFRQDLAQCIPCVPEAARANLVAMQLPELLRTFVNWRDRFVATRPRRVLTWPRFLEDERAQRQRDGINALTPRIISGEDLRPFLSENIATDGYVQPDRIKPRKRGSLDWFDKDYALNAHDTHHLHLSDSIRSDGWSRRTKELLFVSFTRDEAFFVMVGDHKSFDDGSLALAVAEIRAAAGGGLRGILGTTSEAYTPEQRNRLQRRGMTATIRVGSEIVPSALMLANGIGLRQSQYCDRMLDELERHELLLDDPSYVQRWFERAQRPAPPEPRFFWRMEDCDLCLAEATSAIGIRVLDWYR
jgi:hypothetical protein